MTFNELGLSDAVLRAVAEVGYDTPTPIQAQAIPVVLMARDVLGCAQTGTGKTASFVLPMIDVLAQGRAKARMPRSLIIAPTRELAAQVGENFELYGKYNKLNKALLIGGESFTDQEKLLDRGVDVLIATPGRLLDLFERGKILLSDVKILVIDEADRMLDMGFIPDVEKIVSLLPRMRQTLFFSATMPPEIRRLADKFLHNPKEVSVAPPATTAELVEDFLVVVPDDDWTKRQALRELLKAEDVKNALIFCNRKRDVDILFKSLEKHGFNAAPLHGDLAQERRTETLQRFKDGDITLLVASDVAARGLDVQGLSHVFNFDVPYNAEDYVHRIGRTGRAGQKGRAFTVAIPADGKFVAAISKLIGRDITPVTIDGVESDELSDDDRRGRGRGRRGREQRGRPARKPARGKDRPAPEPAPEAANDATPPAPEAPGPAANDRPQKADRPETADRPQKTERTKAKPDDKGRPDKKDRKDGGRDDRRRRGRERELEPVADHKGPGFGDNVPAFLQRPPRSGN